MNAYWLKADLDKFRLTVITGPQRSGTTFAGKAFAHDTRRAYVDERAFGVSNLELWRGIMKGASHCVVQCPTMMKHVHEEVPDDCLVVVMRRDIEDIQRSEKRIGWADNDIELKTYGKTEGISAQVKYDYWDEHKKEGPANWIELEYEKLNTHPLWVPKEKRKDFGTKQTEIWE